jgi:hypothetical protein
MKASLKAMPASDGRLNFAFDPGPYADGHSNMGRGQARFFVGTGFRGDPIVAPGRGRGGSGVRTGSNLATDRDYAWRKYGDQVKLLGSENDSWHDLYQRLLAQS